MTQKSAGSTISALICGLRTGSGSWARTRLPRAERSAFWMAGVEVAEAIAHRLHAHRADRRADADDGGGGENALLGIVIPLEREEEQHNWKEIEQ